MPRKKQTPSADMPRIRRDLKQYLERCQTTPTAFAREHGLNQSTVQRFLVGDTKTVTPRMQSLLTYAKIKFDACISEPMISPVEHPRIRRALERVWDGQDRSAEVLANLIEAVGPVIQQSFSPASGSTGHHGQDQG